MLFICFNTNVVKALRQEFPRYRTYWLTGFKRGPDGAIKPSAASVIATLKATGANGVDAYQKNNNLVLSDGARADSLPGLQIDTDDLKCSHGSTIGNLDAEELFYLRSRGLDENEARRILIKGFCEDIAGRIPYEFVREAVSKQVDSRIG